MGRAGAAPLPGGMLSRGRTREQVSAWRTHTMAVTMSLSV